MEHIVDVAFNAPGGFATVHVFAMANAVCWSTLSRKGNKLHDYGNDDPDSSLIPQHCCRIAADLCQRSLVGQASQVLTGRARQAHGGSPSLNVVRQQIW